MIKKILVYQPPSNPQPFVLGETGPQTKQNKSRPLSGLEDSAGQLDALLRYSRGLMGLMEKTIEVLRTGKVADRESALSAELQALEKQQDNLSPILLGYDSAEGMEERPVSTSLGENKLIIKSLYKMPLNKDVVIRDISIAADPPVKAMLVFVDGLIDKRVINLTILQPLMRIGESQPKLYEGDLVGTIIEEYLPSGQAARIKNFRAVQDAVNSGDTVLFFEGIDEAVFIETKGFEHRSIDRPTTEQSIRGSQNSFSEVMRVNTGLIRSTLHSSDLVTEMIPVGRRGRSNCAIMYLKSVANPSLVCEIKRRIEGIEIDYVNDSGVLEQLISDFPNIPFPQVLSTERPDRVGVHICEGRVAIILDGSPFVLIAPVSIYTLMHSSDDYSLNIYYSNMLRLVRVVGGMLSLLLPAVYLAINAFHQEAIPTELLLSIYAARFDVPFPTIVEILMMEFSFELIREGGLRIPGILGSTIGIVGALILGQAAVTAKIVSPIMVIIIAVTGLASYSMPDYRLATALRLSRFGFILLGALMGLVGIAGGLIVFIAMLCSMKSFGMPYLAPIVPKSEPGGEAVLRNEVFSQERRPDELQPQDKTRQSTVTRKWFRNDSQGEDS